MAENLQEDHMKILTFPDPHLRSFGLSFVNEGDNLDVIKHLVATLEQSKTGIGLAANQIGFHQAIFVMAPERSRASFAPVVIGNPTFIGYGGMTPKQEGCLSFPGVFERVERWEGIHAEFDLIDIQTGKFTHAKEDLTGIQAHVFQHETEHLSGVLMIDHLDERLQSRITKRMEKRKSRGY